MNYIVQNEDGCLDNNMHEITCEQLKILYDDNIREEKESQEITKSSYKGENFYTPGGNHSEEFEKEVLLRDSKTAGMRIYYPHGIVIQQAGRRNYYRGENQIFKESIPSLLRTLKQYSNQKEKELYRFVADMRIAEFKFLLERFEHVINWDICDILYEPLAQHYGLETGWIDITSDFNVALFFATCYWDNMSEAWKPLTKEQTEIDENHKYGVIFHMPSYQMPTRWDSALERFSIYKCKKNEKGEDICVRKDITECKGNTQNLIYPIGFQPFMRCHMQNAYGIYMREDNPLQNDLHFEKLKFRHNEQLSQKVFDLMKGGELIYPHEGLKQADFIIKQIKSACCFSEEAFQYALYRNHWFTVKDANLAKKELQHFSINDQHIEIGDRHPWKMSSGRRQKINLLYHNFSVQRYYGINILDRLANYNKMFEPWMLPEEADGEGIKDFYVSGDVKQGFSIQAKSWISLLSTIRNGQLSDF